MPTMVSTDSATTRDGTRLAYTLRSGGAARARLVLVHSLAMTGAFWTPVAERLAQDFDILTYDCRGHGESGKPAGPYDIRLFADDLADLLDHVGWKTAAVAGASMGGTVALAFAAAYAGRTDALGLIDTTAWYGAEAPKNWAERAEKAKQEGLQALVGFQKTRWFTDNFREQHPEVVDACVDFFLKNDINAFAATCHMLGATDLRPALAGMSLPAAVMVGEEDYATPVAMAEVLHQGIAGASLSIIGNARHLTPLEHPDVVADGLKQLLTRETR
ncbi:MAG: putative lactone hydrolase [Herminiimonas sp.]|nr:putative lactone hydrolase [Herminiimonas sp.]